MAATGTIGTFCATASKLCSVLALMKKSILPTGEQDAVVHVRAARHDGHVEPVLAVGAVGERLVEAAVLALRHPIGAERDFVELLGVRGDAATANSQRNGKSPMQHRSLRRHARGTGSLVSGDGVDLSTGMIALNRSLNHLPRQLSGFSKRNASPPSS